MAKKEKYEDISTHVVELLGGKDNIVFFTHCVTRLRFNVKDKTRVNQDEIEKLDKVIGAQWSGEQFQIIVGQDVGTAYKEVLAHNDLSGDGEVPADDTPKKKFSFNSVLDAIAGSITPLIPLLIGGGMFKVLLLVLTMLGVLTTKSPSYVMLNAIGDAAFYFLPVFVGATAAKKFGVNQGIGMLLGAMLLDPNFVTAVSSGHALSLFGISVYATTYGNMVFPSILAVFITSYVEKFFTRWTPDSLKSLIVPFFTLLIMAPLTFWLLAPAGAFLGTYLTKFILWIYGTAGFLGVAILAAALPWIVMTGMHTAFTPYAVQTLATTGTEPIVFIANFISNLDQGAASLAVGLKTHHNEKLRSTALSCAVTAILAGVTEPAMFGVNLKLKTPMYGAMIGSFFGGGFAGFMGVKAYAMAGSAGLLGTPVFIGKTIMTFVWALVGMAIGMVITFIATMILYKESPATASQKVEKSVTESVNVEPVAE
ncbi:PTS transporter subunit EIIC [Pediococcus ethanolidurans]|uniref:PTS system beta-glucosides-specific iiABC component n=1 Tax=Pediococcus ethanolidurans TaxID=319653 RepID=A0A0R2K706_9LACO|nr:PTS transporter subunit EIIC [Pediococcus ethanolidurans]KRN83638.1 PTS system beta-glucosides-specific iiABC component [Pediococcus ethanolidurans]GEN94007.1 hypothetical protein PET01_00570 [Pediococcus ethanolidurans]SER01579.1 PTS system, beta-glucosides-specific IIC component [Pediococcus ethanolidurans]